MNAPTDRPTPPPARASSALAWLLTVIAIGLAMLSTTLVFALDIQRTELQARQAQLTRTYPLRELESKRLAANSVTEEAELDRLVQAYTDGKSDFTRLSEARTKREALVNQSTDLQLKVESLVVDLLILSKSDHDAQALVTKYHIHQDSPTAAPSVSPADR